MATNIARGIAVFAPTAAILYMAGRYLGQSQATIPAGKFGSQSRPKAPLTSLPHEIDWSKYANKQPAFSTGDTVFTFGPGGNHFLATKGTPGTMSWMFQTRKGSLISTQFEHTVGGLHFCAMSPHGDELVAYQHRLNKADVWDIQLSPDRYAQAPTYTSLLRWLGKNVKPDPKSMSQSLVVFGEGSTCFARNAHSCFWQDLPERLEDILLEKREQCAGKEPSEDEDAKHAWIPRIVALGANQTWVAVWQDGSYAWALREGNALLDNVKTDKGTGEPVVPIEAWENIVLSPHSAVDYFGVLKNGSLRSSFTQMDADSIISLSAVMYRFTQFRAKEINTTSNFSLTVNGKTVEMTVSPTTDWTLEELQKLFSEKQRRARLWPLQNWFGSAGMANHEESLSCAGHTRSLHAGKVGQAQCSTPEINA